MGIEITANQREMSLFCFLCQCTESHRRISALDGIGRRQPRNGALERLPVLEGVRQGAEATSWTKSLVQESSPAAFPPSYLVELPRDDPRLHLTEAQQVSILTM